MRSILSLELLECLRLLYDILSPCYPRTIHDTATYVLRDVPVIVVCTRNQVNNCHSLYL